MVSHLSPRCIYIKKSLKKFKNMKKIVFGASKLCHAFNQEQAHASVSLVDIIRDCS